MKFSENAEENLKLLKEELRTEENFDIIYRVLMIDGHMAFLFCIDGFTKDEILEKLLEFLMKQTEGKSDRNEFPDSAHEFSKLLLPYGEIGIQADADMAVDALLKGQSLLIVDGYREALVIDCRTYPARSVSEPEKDKTMRGPRDGFVETLVFNTALVRRRIRDRRLSMEIHSAGIRSKTDICLCYLCDRVDRKLLEMIRKRIDSIRADALTMGQESLAECIFPHKWFDPFPKFKFTERPDAAAAAVLEGNLLILIDNSPSAVILPSSVFDIIEEADDYYFPPITGTYLRLVRTIISMLTYFIPVTFLLCHLHPEYLPEWLQFTAVKDPVNIPVFVQLIVLELALDSLRLAAVNTPGMLSTPLSITAGLVLGEFSVRSGWFNSETMLYMAFVFVANYSQSSYEFAYAVKFMRILTLILTAAFGVWGYGTGVVITVLSLVFNRTLSGYPYLYPVIPFSWKRFSRRFIRGRLTDKGDEQS